MKDSEVKGQRSQHENSEAGVHPGIDFHLVDFSSFERRTMKKASRYGYTSNVSRSGLASENSRYRPRIN
jgi:hypothetical protein